MHKHTKKKNKLIKQAARILSFDNIKYTKNTHDGKQVLIGKLHSKYHGVNNNIWMVFIITLLSGVCICGGMVFLCIVCIGGGCAYFKINLDHKLNRKEMLNVLSESDHNIHHDLV